MSGIAPVGEIAAHILGDLPPGVMPPAAAPVDPSGGFGKLFTDGLSQVNEKLMAGQTDLQRLATGDVQNLHQIMINLEESRLSLQLMMQVRNRMLEAYQDIMKMQI